MTTAIGQPEIVIDEPDGRPIERHPSDVLRLVVALLVSIVGFLLATMLNNISEAFTVEVIDTVSKVPSVAVVVVITTVLLFASLLPLLSWGYLAWLRQWRRLVLGLLASAVAMGLVWLIGAEVVSRFSSPDLVFTPPSWICGEHLADSTQVCVSGDTSLHTYYLAGGVAFFSSLAPWMTKRWRRAAWITITVLVVVRMIQGLTPPLDEFLVIGISYAVGAAVLLAFGTPSRRPRGRDIVTALDRSGIQLSELKLAGVDARGSTPYFAATSDGDRIFVKVLSPEERSADILFRIFRLFRLKGVGDEGPFSSL